MGLHVHRITDGRLEVTCGRCLKQSDPVVAADADAAWIALDAIGWTWFRSERGGMGYCPRCTAAGPPDVAKRAARRRR